MWSIPLNNPDRFSKVFDSNARKIVPRYAVRRKNDTSHVYCIVETIHSQSVSVVRVSLDQHDGEKLRVDNIYEVYSTKIVLIEPDPDNSKQLFVLEDDQKLTRIEDKGENKATINASNDLTHHLLEEAIAKLDN